MNRELRQHDNDQEIKGFYNNLLTFGMMINMTVADEVYFYNKLVIPYLNLKDLDRKLSWPYLTGMSIVELLLNNNEIYSLLNTFTLDLL